MSKKHRFQHQLRKLQDGSINRCIWLRRITYPSSLYNCLVQNNTILKKIIMVVRYYIGQDIADIIINSIIPGGVVDQRFQILMTWVHSNPPFDLFRIKITNYKCFHAVILLWHKNKQNVAAHCDATTYELYGPTESIMMSTMCQAKITSISPSNHIRATIGSVQESHADIERTMSCYYLFLCRQMQPLCNWDFFQKLIVIISIKTKQNQHRSKTMKTTNKSIFNLE